MEEFRSGNGARWLDFLATLIGRYRGVQTDQLSDSRALRDWFVQHDLSPVEAPAERDLGRAKALREALHAAAVATMKGTNLEATALKTLESALQCDRPLSLRRTAEGLKAVRPANTQEALARLAREAMQTLIGPDKAALHACGDDTCSGIFIDKVGKRRWCTDERCGNRARVRAHRARAREGSA
jgi:predicted RNA-binding Zn ribbon-like protein